MEHYERAFEARTTNTQEALTVTSFRPLVIDGDGQLSIEFFDGDPAQVTLSFTIGPEGDSVRVFEQLAAPITDFAWNP